MSGPKSGFTRQGIYDSSVGMCFAMTALAWEFEYVGFDRLQTAIALKLKGNAI